MGEKAEKNYKITEKKLRQLLEAAHNFYALECGGVDNWSFYGDSMWEYYEECLKDCGVDPEGIEVLSEAKNVVIDFQLENEFELIEE